jgi:hypothetical protein
MTNSFKKDDGTGMSPPPTGGAASGAVTSREATRKNPRQGIKIDRNKHGIRRETSLIPKPPKKTGRKKV